MQTIKHLSNVYNVEIDVVAAHKKLIAEKEQLEETLRTISHSIETPSDKYPNSDVCKSIN